MESRIYAEDSLRNFLPSVGVLHRYVPPVDHEGVRIDTGVEEGSNISIFYDPMIAKLVTHGKDREEAIRRMKKALDEYVIKGVVCNINFVRDVMDNERFMRGELTTHFIDQEYPAPGFKGHLLTEAEGEELASIAGMLYTQHYQQSKIFLSATGSKVAGKETVGSAALLSVMSTADIIGEKDLVVTMTGTVGEPIQKLVHIKSYKPELGDVISTSFKINVDGKPPAKFKATLPANSGLYVAKSADGHEQTVQLVDKTYAGYVLSMAGSPYEIKIWSPRIEELSKIMPVKEAVDRSNELRTPMPGKVHSIAVEVGEDVLAGQEMCVVEAMKMQNVLRSPKDGVVRAIHVKVGENLNLEDLILELD